MKPKPKPKPFKLGQRVRVKVRGLPYAHIDYLMKDVEGGVVLDRSIQGFRFWNVEDLLRVNHGH